uniref:Syntaxin-8 n=1 Tax=Callorhinchus milii TaxID=7868 RepID=A0A4W3JMK9_CALMI
MRSQAPDRQPRPEPMFAAPGGASVSDTTRKAAAAAGGGGGGRGAGRRWRGTAGERTGGCRGRRARQGLRLVKYDSTCQLAQEAAEHIHERNRQKRTGGNPAKLNATIRVSLQKLQEQISQLKEALLRSLSILQITQLEADRRQNLVDDLLTKERQLQANFKKDGTEPDMIRSSLMSGEARNRPNNPWLTEETEETKGLDFGEIKHQQQRIIQEQDVGLDALATVIARQKQMGQDIGNELDEHNEIIDDLTHLVDKTDSRIRNESRRVKVLDKKSTSCELDLNWPKS